MYIRINTSDKLFKEHKPSELRRIFDDITRKIEYGKESGGVVDRYGRKIGC